ncbi:hypothetical protein AMTR_s00104p00073820 [Amborella trichopoda]|uniref:Uncharacterized protein n=1 Tax=Amborella trichopoda TaxID=13333 RepID=W1NT17_AMBTC|nr:hypothetical protein AMTR_s00104p00073820 [Amborella trichopoda]
MSTWAVPWGINQPPRIIALPWAVQAKVRGEVKLIPALVSQSLLRAAPVDSLVRSDALQPLVVGRQ